MAIAHVQRSLIKISQYSVELHTNFCGLMGMKAHTAGPVLLKRFRTHTDDIKGYLYKELAWGKGFQDLHITTNLEWIMQPAEEDRWI